MVKSIGRNNLCPCDSGKKYKKCCIGKQPRNQYVYIGYREPYNGVTFNNGQAYVHLPSGQKAKADVVFSQTQYTKASGGDKVLSRIINLAAFSIPATLASNFEVILAIDTNTKKIGSDDISVSSIFECHAKKNDITQLINLEYAKYGNLFHKNCPHGQSEKYAWFGLVTLAMSSPSYGKNYRIAVVTDHDLNRHTRYNARELPIYKDFYLPDNFTLLYASSDTGDKNILNQLIRKCDKDAKNILQQLEEKGCQDSEEGVKA